MGVLPPPPPGHNSQDMHRPLAGFLLRKFRGPLSFSCSTFYPSRKDHVLRKTQGKSLLSVGSTKLRTVFFHVLLFTVQCTIFRSFNLAVCSTLTVFICSFRKYTPLLRISGDFLRAYLAHYKSIVLILRETNAIKCLSHPVFITRTVNAFTHVPDIPTRFFPICRLFFVTINHYLSLSIT